MTCPCLYANQKCYMKLLKIVGIVCLGILTMVSLLWWGCAPHQPSDQTLEKRFYKQRSDLEHLIAMMDEDWQMCSIAPNFTYRQDNAAWPRPESEWGISAERWNEYRKMFTQANFKEGVTRPEKSSDVVVHVWSWGIVPSGTSVNYLHFGTPRNGYTNTEPPCLEKRDSGAGMYGSSSSYGYRYKKIAGDWYIYEQSN
jgi:hypothetical protein